MGIAYDHKVVFAGEQEKQPLNDLDSIPFSTEHCFEQNDVKRFRLAVKRGLDLSVATLALLIFLPLLLFIGILVRMTSRGPALFTQTRWGRGGSKIKVYKFRTMYQDLGDETGVAQTSMNDPRITALGAVLRRTNLDELPQLLNVIKGDMSLVGPRPHAIGMLAAGVPYEQLVPDYHRRHAMRPGITGLAQMRGLRGPTVLASKARARIAADLFYVDNFSLMLDIKIILGTLRSEVIGGSGF